ncbi:mammalian uncoordinated homology 13 protein [Tanacetum coccineum]
MDEENEVELLQRYRRDRKILLNYLLSGTLIKKVVMPPGAVSLDDVDLDQVSVDFVLNSVKKDFVGLPRMQPSLELIVDLLSPFSKSRTTRCVVSKLVLAATAYFLWRERNDRLFKKGKNMVEHVIGSIKSSVRLKLLSCRFKKSKAGLDILKQ